MKKVKYPGFFQSFKFEKNSRALLFLLICFFVFPFFLLNAETVFSDLDLSEDNRLIFKVSNSGPGSAAQSALFASFPGESRLTALTAFPEELDLIENNRTVEVRNAFGVMRIPVTGGLPASVPVFDSFADGEPLLGGRPESTASSFDGRWILTVDPVTPAYGNLVLFDTASGGRTLVSEHIERPGSYFPAAWSPDSRVFVYERGGLLYSCQVETESNAVDERYRLIGEGKLRSVYWGAMGDFYYLKKSSVFRVRASELFTRAFYTGFLEIGSIAGSIPFEFDPAFDRFWVSPDSASLVVSKGGKSLFYFPLGDHNEASFPNVVFSRPGAAVKVLWPASGSITALVLIPGKNGASFHAYRLARRGADKVFTSLENPSGLGAALSPDGSKVLFWGEEGLFVYDYAGWKKLARLSYTHVYAAAWMGNNDVIIGGTEKIELVSLSGPRKLICLSEAPRSGFDESSGRFAAALEDAWYATDGKSPWQPLSAPAVRKPSLVSSKYRVYLENRPEGPYRNLPMIRDIAAVSTFPLLSGNVVYEQVPATGSLPDEYTAGIFTNGKRTGRRELAVSFDLIDNAEGVPEVLATLARFNIKATFFLNGEFIRRYPALARDIAEAGHETASMFFADIDISDSRYTIDRDFIVQGLGRNEDEFFGAAKTELSLIWHAPYYIASSVTIAAAASAGYKTIGKDVDPGDWILRENARRMGRSQIPASDMVDTIMAQKKPGSIIPIRLGLLPGGRDDYLFQRLDVLFDALVRSGYSVVPVSTLIEHGR